MTADDRRQQLADEVVRHRMIIGADQRVVICLCGGWSSEDEANLRYPIRLYREHVAYALLPLLDRVAADAAAEALEKAAQSWRWSAWSDVPRIADRVQERIGTANYVGDWIAARAVELRAPARTDEEN